MSKPPDAIEFVGLLKDRVDNLIGALKLPLPADTQIARVNAALEDISKEARKVFVNETGADPWDI